MARTMTLATYRAVARPQLILLRCLPGAHQIAERLVRRVRHPHRRQIAGAIAARQCLGITPIGLDPIPRLHWDQRWGHHLTPHPEGGQLPIDHIPRRARFVADAQ
jgi:hypothetical protein